jgi:hypothetical protein
MDSVHPAGRGENKLFLEDEPLRWFLFQMPTTSDTWKSKLFHVLTT